MPRLVSICLALVAAAAVAVGAALHPPPGMDEGFDSPTFAYSQGGHAICVSGTVAIEATVNNTRLGFPNRFSQFFVTDLLQRSLLDSPSPASEYNLGPQLISGSYGVAVTLCVPKDRSNVSSTLQILNHGLGGDRSYWDIAPGYSFVDAMAAAGYASLNFVLRAQTPLSAAD